jgi:glycosyltransferase involved in cell wall biosynthesis
MERQMTALARNLDRRRFEPHVATVIEGFRAEELRRHGIPILPIPIRSFWDPGPWALVRYLRDYIRRHNIKLVHLFDAGLSAVTVGAVRSTRGVKLLTSQRFYMHLASRKYRYMLLAAHWMADGVVANSEAVRRHLHQDFHFPLNRVEVCHNGVDIQMFSPQPRRRLEQLRDASLVIGSVCVLRAEKNLEHLIEAFARVRGQAPGSKLLLMGSGPEEAMLKALSERLGVGQACCFLPSSADVSQALRSIDIFVHPSLSEGLPNSVMEAMACGCTVIATRVGGCAELIEHGVHGLLVPPGDLEMLAEELSRAIAQPDLSHQMAQAGAKRMEEEFSLTAAAERIQAIYERRLAR